MKNLRSRRRSNRERVTAPEPTETAVSVTGGFATIPVELLSEILSCIPRPVDPMSTESWHTLFKGADAEDYLAWRKALSSLSQTCRRWREFFWPQLWRRIDICEGMYNDKHEKLTKALPAGAGVILDRHLNVELVRQLEIVTVRGPYLADYIQSINVEVAEFSIKRVLTELARCLTHFSNLRTVKLQILPSDKRLSILVGLIKSVFSKYKYPHIRSVSICDLTYPFLSSCPEARSVCWNLRNSSPWDEPILSLGPLPSFPAVEHLQFSLPYDRDLKDIASTFPNICEFSLNGESWMWREVPSLDFIPLLSKLRKLVFFMGYIEQQEVKRSFSNALVGQLRNLQKLDPEEKTAVIYWSADLADVKPTMVEKRVLPASRN